MHKGTRYSEKLPEIKRLYQSEGLSALEVGGRVGLPGSTVRWLLREKLGVGRGHGAAARLWHKWKRFIVVIIALRIAGPAWLVFKVRLPFTCRACGEGRPISDLGADRRYFPILYCCKKCRGA